MSQKKVKKIIPPGEKGNVANLSEALMKKKMENPAKTFKVEPADVQTMAKFNMATSRLKQKLSVIRYEYLKAEENIFNALKSGMEEMDKHETMVKEKYKIIGQIQAYDVGKNEIYLV